MSYWVSKTSYLLLAGLSINSMALAAESSENIQKINETEIEKIKIVGSKMNQVLKDSAMSVTVYDKEMIAKNGMNSLRDIDDYSPNVSISQIGQVGGSYISIRGIESNPFIVNRTAVYIDGIPYRNPDSLRLNNVNQIEILRGPQGTLYGSNADAGVVVMSTQTPYQEFQSTVGYQLKSFDSGETHTINFNVSGGISENLTASFNAEIENGDSYIRNISSSLGLSGEIKDTALSTKFRYIPNDKSQIDIIMYYNDLDAPGLYEQEFPALDIKLYNQTYGSNSNAGNNVGDFELANDAPKKTNKDEWGTAIGYQYDFDENEFNFSASYRRENETYYGADFDLTASPISAGGSTQSNYYFDLETRLSNLDNQGIDWTIGATVSKESVERNLLTLIGTGEFEDFSKAPLQTIAPESWALFGQLIIPLTDNLNLTTGMRYTRASTVIEQKEGVLDLGVIGEFAFPEVHEESKTNEWVPKVALDYTFNDGTLIYSSISKGFLPGGYNLVAADKGSAIADEHGSYQAEKLWSYEIGAKRELFNGSTFISAAAFLIDASSWQEYSVLTDENGQVLSTTLINSNASIESKGFEIELRTNPIDTLTIIAGLGYIDAKYKDYQFSATENYAGERVKMVPEFDLSLSLIYDITDHWYVKSDVQGIGETPLTPDNKTVRDSLWLVGLSTGYEADNWSMRAYVKNLTNKRYAAGLSYLNFTFGDDGNVYAPIADPRVIGIELDWRF